jgi:hypothetical protein
MPNNPLGLKLYSVQGRNGPGPISVPGVSVGDVIGLIHYNDHGRVVESHGPFDNVVSVDDEIHQFSLADLSIILPFHVYIIV